MTDWRECCRQALSVSDIQDVTPDHIDTANGHNVVTVNLSTLFINKNATIRITIQSNPQVCAVFAYSSRNHFRMS